MSDKTPIEELINECYNGKITIDIETLIFLNAKEKAVQAKHKEDIKQAVVGCYLTCEMKGHNLPFGMDYYNLLEEKTEQAEQYYKENYE